MLRVKTICGAALVMLLVAYRHGHGGPVTASNLHHAHRGRATAIRADAARTRRHVALRAATPLSSRARHAMTHQLPPPAVDLSVGTPISLSYQVPPAALDTSPDRAAARIPAHPEVTLSEQESEVSRIADANGDKKFLMVDKALGKIILFEDGQAVFSGPALTGASLTDRLPKQELSEKFDDLNALDTKITPAGRFTVQRGYDKEVGGELFDVHEIRGKDWGIAIHPVYLGIPSEHRDVRIMSPSVKDKHITFGCINVTPDALQFLLRKLPEKGLTPLYILPIDASQTTAYFTSRTS